MKALTIVTVLLLTISSQASFFQEDCSSANTSMIYSSGHIGNEFSVKFFTRSKDGKKMSLKLDRAKATISVLNSIVLKEKKYNSCDLDKKTKYGVVSLDRHTAREITITNNDDSSFPKNLYGLSKDKKTINAIILCHNVMNSQIFCEDN